jgi:hypothetical protein
MAFVHCQARISAEAAHIHATADCSLFFSQFEKNANNSFDAIDFATYCPGDLLRQSVTTLTTISTKDHDDVSEVSTADPQDSVSFEDMEPDDNVTLGRDQTRMTSLLSNGSAEHASGHCKPCGFFHKAAGCSAGSACKFCHLCPPGSIEKKRKSKRQFVRTARHHEPSLLVAASEACSLSL